MTTSNIEAGRVMMSAHALCPIHLSHPEKMRWMADHFLAHYPHRQPAVSQVDAVVKMAADIATGKFDMASEAMRTTQTPRTTQDYITQHLLQVDADGKARIKQPTLKELLALQALMQKEIVERYDAMEGDTLDRIRMEGPQLRAAARAISAKR